MISTNPHSRQGPRDPSRSNRAPVEPSCSPARAGGRAEWSRWSVALAVLAGIHLGSGCDDGAGSPDDGGATCEPSATQPDGVEAPPGVHIVFPPASSLTDAATLTVRGTALFDEPVTAIRVNGIPAQTGDDFRHWQVSVALEPGVNTLVVEREDDAGQTDPAAAEVTVVRALEPLLEPEAVVLDLARDRALVVEAKRNVLMSVDLTTGERAALYQGPAAGSATLQAIPPDPPDPMQMADVALLDAAGQGVLVAGRGAVFSVDLETGEHTVISAEDVGEGPALAYLEDMALDAEQERALVVSATGALLSVDLRTGARAVIADGSTGSGPSLATPSAVVLDAQAGRALVTTGQGEQAALVAVDLTSGDRAVISGRGTGSGPALHRPADAILDAGSDRALIVDEGHDGVIAVELATGERTMLASAAPGDEPGLALPAGMALDAAQGRALVVDRGRDALIAVELQTGRRSQISGDTTGSGPALRAPYAMALDAQARRVFVGDPEAGALLSVDLGTGARAVVSSDAAGSGPSLGDVRAVALDASRRRILAASFDDQSLVSVDADTGERALVSSGARGSGPGLSDPRSLIIDEAGNQALVGMGYSGLLAVDLDTGDRALLPTSIEDITWLGLEPACDRVLIASGSIAVHSLFTMSLDTGEVELLTDYVTCAGGPVGALVTPVYDAGRGRVLGWHDQSAVLAAVDTGTGACTTQVSLAVEAGGPWPYPRRAMALDPVTGLLLLADEVNKALIALDPETGERVIVSR